MAQGVFPGGVCLWGPSAQKPQIAFGGFLGLNRNIQPVSLDVLYDLASVSKIISTTSLCMILAQRGQLDLEASVLELLPLQKPLQTDLSPLWAKIKVRHLLSHQSGLLPWLPLYSLSKITGGECGVAQRKKAALKAILNSPLNEGPPKTVYSDLGFILLGFILERILNLPLGEAFKQEIAKPLGLFNLTYNPTASLIAPGEDGFRVGGPIGSEKDEFRRAAIFGPTPVGVPNDDNCAFLGGQGGHAGLFGAAEDVWAVACDWALALRKGVGRIFLGPTVEKFIKNQGEAQALDKLSTGELNGARPLGFDINSSGGHLENSGFSASTVGHLGYTGTSVWWDVHKDFLWVFLSNRINPSARNPKINQFRRTLAQLICP
ncbi:MAG: serine hydrolase domain-containing protein [Candidatus Adiutrix sp.]